jgi:hypothetical protein
MLVVGSRQCSRENRVVADERPITAAVETPAKAESLTPEQVWQWLIALADQLATLHDCGRLHGAVRLENITLDEAGQPQLVPPAATIECNPGDGHQQYPPEMQGKTVGQLSTELAVAHKRLVQAGIAIDPRRIDAYQLGALLCRLTGQTGVDAYLRSAKARAKVSKRLRPIIDRCLGFDPNDRFTDCRQVCVAVRQADEASRAAEADTPALGIIDPSSLHTPPTGHRPATGRRDDATPPVPAFAHLGGYRILERIGGGGMGDVFKAIDEGLQRVVAIKVLPPELARHPDFVRRFRAEATAIARLVHPNVVQVFACGEDAGHHYFVMQFVPGESLAGLLARRAKLDIDETLPIIAQCLAGLAAAHAQGLIHRDIKPGNILLDHEHGRALVADFGLVKTSGGGENLTATGVIMGTVDYIPPEQARGLKVDSRSDLYSVGALMYRMLSGRLPFESDSPTGMIFQHAFEQPRPLRDVAPEVPEALAAIVMRLLEKYPNNRYQSAEELNAAIAAFRAGKPLAQPALRAAAPHRPEPLPGIPHDTDAWAPVTQRRGWHTRLWTLFHAHAPAALKELLDTQHQLDGAVLEYQRRRDQLAQLAQQAQQVAADFNVQVRQHRQAAAEAAQRAASTADAESAAEAQRQQAELQRVADEFAAQLADQQEQLHDLRLQLAQVDATLSKLRSQRDILQARLKTAQAEMSAGAAGSPARRRARPIALAAGLVLLSAVLGIYVLRSGKSVLTVPPPMTARLRDDEFAAVSNPRSPGAPLWPGTDSGGWSALAGLVDPTRDKLDASWMLSDDAVEFSAHKPRAYVSIPVRLDGSYELAGRITIVRAKETTALYLPVGKDKAVVLDLRGDNGNTESPTATTHLLGLRPAPRAEAAATIRVGTEYDYLVKVIVGDTTAEIVVHRDGQLLYRWSGPLTAVSGKNIRPGTIGFETAYYTVSRIHGLRLKMIAGEAKPIAAE